MVKKEVLQQDIFEKEIWADGRGVNHMRELQCEAETYLALHGSSLFSRGRMQALCTVTMGAPDDAKHFCPIADTLYMEGYALDRFVVGAWGRQPVHQNWVWCNFVCVY